MKPRTTAFSRWLNDKIATIRIDPGDLAEKADLSEAYISMLRRGRRRPSYEAVVALTFALGADQDLDKALAAAERPSGEMLAPRTRMAHILKRMASVHQASQKAQREHEAIAAISSISPKLTVEQVLCRILDGITDLISFDYGNITLVDWERHEIDVLAHKTGPNPAGYGRSPLTPTRWPVTVGVTGWVARHAKPKRVPDVRTDRDYLCHWSESRAELAVPLILDGTVLGVLNIESETVDYFTERHEHLLETIAENVAAVVERARLVQIDSEWRERFESLTDLHKSILESRDDVALLELVAQRIVKLFPDFDLCVIREHDPVHRRLLFMGVGSKVPLSPAVLEALRAALPVDDSITGKAIRDRHPTTSPNVQLDLRFNRQDLAKALNLRGMMAVPLPAADSREPAVGCLSAYTVAERHQFRSDHVRLLEQIANFVAIALANLRTTLVLNAHRDTAEACRQASSSRAAFDSIASLISKKTGAQGASIFLVEGGLLRLKGTTGILNIDDYASASYQLGEGKTGWVAATVRPLRLIERTGHESSSYAGLVEAHKFEEQIPNSSAHPHLGFLAVPIMQANGDLAGVARAVAKQGYLPFTPQDERVVEAIAYELGVTLGVIRAKDPVVLRR